jgi:hypothetical protein
MPASLPKRRFVRTKPAADRVGVSESNLNKRRVRGLPPAFIKLGKTVLYDTVVLDEWIDSCRRQSTSEPPTPAASLLRRASAATPSAGYAYRRRRSAISSCRGKRRREHSDL